MKAVTDHIDRLRADYDRALAAALDARDEEPHVAQALMQRAVAARTALSAAERKHQEAA